MSRQVVNKIEPLTKSDKKFFAYAFIGITTWLTKAFLDTKNDFEKNKFEKKCHNDINHLKELALLIPAKNLIYYSPNIIFWPVNFGIDIYAEGVLQYYKYKSEKQKQIEFDRINKINEASKLNELNEQIDSFFAAKNIAKEPENFGLETVSKNT